MIARRSVWSDPEVKSLASRFVPAADEVHLLQVKKDAEGELFRKVAERGHYGGREAPTGTRQGTYALTASGEFLSSINTSDPRIMAAMLREALDRWHELTAKQRKSERLDGSVIRPEDRYPKDGLVLRVFSRDLPRATPPKEDWRGLAWNQDFSWFSKDEALAMVPEAEVGASREMPWVPMRRVVRLNLVDNVRGQTPPYEEANIKEAHLLATVTKVEASRIELRLEGIAANEAVGRWPINDFRDMRTPTPQRRGVEVKMLGYATFDRKRERFARFELLAIGKRWGATQFNGRADDLEPAPIGFFMALAGDTPAERVAPASWWAYGWRL